VYDSVLFLNQKADCGEKGDPANFGKILRQVEECREDKEERMRGTLTISGNLLWRIARLFICSALLSTAILEAGTLFVTVEGTGQILQFTSGGVASTFASGLNVPIGLAFDSSGNLYEADSNYPNFGNGVIYKFTPGGVRSTFASGLGDPVSLAVDATGNVYVGDDYDQNIYKFTPGGVRSTFASSVYPAGLAFDGAGNLYEADSGFAVNSTVGRINEFAPGGTEGTFASGLGYPVGLAFDASGNLYASDAHLGAIFEFAPGGTESTFASGLSSAGFLAFDGNGNLFAVDQTGFIYEFTPGGVRSTFASGLSGPVGLAFSPMSATIQPPIAADGSSVFKANRGVVPVKFTLTVNGVATCNLPPATISLTETSGDSPGPVNASEYETSADNGSNFRIDTTDCQYVYNLGTRGLGAGTYLVQINISGTVVGSATFGLN
jgi:sugar lactone lactonase YvrE